MSSLIGHAAAGATAFLATYRLHDAQARPLLPVFALLAICPDFDYFALWFFHAAAETRFTHSLLFCVVVATIAAIVLRRSGSHRPNALHGMPAFALFAAALSHPTLDLLVGAHPLPLLWPLAEPDVSAPIGLLPSAGRPSPSNPYLWRNLAIELGVLLPVFAAMIGIARGVSLRILVRWALPITPVWLAFLAWSVGLQR